MVLFLFRMRYPDGVRFIYSLHPLKFHISFEVQLYTILPVLNFIALYYMNINQKVGLYMNVSAMMKLTISMAIFGSIGFFTIHTGIPAVELVFVRCIFASVFLSAMWFFTGGHKHEEWNRKEIIQTLFCGIFLVLNWVFLFKAFEEMSISVAISIYNLAPIFVLILGAILLKERMTVRGILATVICFIGSIFIVGIDNFTSIEQFFNSGFVWALLSAICYASTMFLSKTLSSLSPYATTFCKRL